MFDQRRNGTVLAEEQIRLLTLVDIFEPLSREEIEKITWRHLNTSVGRGETFYTPMDLCETLFVLQKGRVRIYRATPEGREFTLAVLQSGTVFGEMVLTGQRLRNCYAQAVEESEVSAMCRADVERLILDKPQVGLQLVHLLSDRLSTYETRLEAIALKEVPARLASLILLLIEGEGVRNTTGYKIPTRYTHQQLGSMIGANREADGEFHEHPPGEEGVQHDPSGSDLADEDELRVQRTEEELAAGTREREAGALNVRKRVRTDREQIEVPTRREEVTVERRLRHGRYRQRHHRRWDHAWGRGQALGPPAAARRVSLPVRSSLFLAGLSGAPLLFAATACVSQGKLQCLPASDSSPTTTSGTPAPP